jgi:hypothetical protein
MIDIFIKSYYKDFKFLNYCLKSIEKYVTGYENIHIVVPYKDIQIFNAVVHTDFPIKLHHVNEYGDGYLYQQYCKMTAYKWCQSKFIMFVDSDCLFYTPTDLTKLVRHDKPEILYTHYSKVGDAICWKECTERFMNDTVHHEYMRRLPLIYHRDTLEKIHSLEPNLENIIMNSGRFSEFNALGAWAHRYESHKYRFENTDNWQYVDAIIKQLWSHCRNNNSKLEKEEYQKAVNEINNVLGLNINQL